MNKSNSKEFMFRKSTMSPDDVIARLQELYEKQNRKKAITLTKAYAKKYDQNPAVLVAIAALGVSFGQKKLPKKLLETALRNDPSNIRGHYNLGLLDLKSGNFSLAEERFVKVVTIDPSYTAAVQNLLYILVKNGDGCGLKAWFKKMGSQDNWSQNSLLQFVKAFKSLNLDVEFVEAAKLLIEMDPNSFESNFNFALALQRLGKNELAQKYYKEALLIKPNDIEASNNLGKLFFDQGDIRSAIRLLDKADLSNSRKPAILHNMGVALYAVGELDKAKKYLQRSAELDPATGDPHYSLGLIAKDRTDYDAAHYHFSTAIQRCDIETSMYTDSVAQKWLLARYSLDWRISDAIDNSIPELGITTTHIAPFTALPMEDNPQSQLLRAKKFSLNTYGSNFPVKDFAHYKSAEIINIAYISADFHQFPGMTLMSGMFSAHDRSKFKVYALSYGPDRNDSMRQKIVRDVDKFIDVKDFTDDEVVSLCSNLNIHIAIHRNGYTKLHRTGIFAKRVAPVQINYLGYPSTMGAEFMDYLVADKFIIPEKYRKFYSENIIYMPNCYQPNDASREWPSDSKNKLDHGLDENKLTLCCFNNPYKISNAEFSIWAGILSEYTDTQLWLLDPGQLGRENIKKLLTKMNISMDRVIFAPKVDHDSHVARHVHADIFVDTFNYNAHTTATDALGMGVPVVTMAGRQFSARVAGSILHSAKLSELVATSTCGYKKKICELIENKDKLKELKADCLMLRKHNVLFNTSLYTENFEQGLLRAFENFKESATKTDIFV